MTFGCVVAFGAALAVGMTGCATREDVTRGEPLLTKAAIISTEATVAAINHRTRELTLKGQGGETIGVTVSDEVKNLSQVRPGDRVTVDYLEAVTVDVFRAGEVLPGTRLLASAQTAAPGERPAALATSEAAVVAVIEAVDEANELVTLRLPGNRPKTVKVGNPAILTRLNVGDKVATVFTRAWAVQVSEGHGAR